MSKTPKDLRIPIMMSSSEVDAIDNWRFANKIATRAEAVRRLCIVALTVFENGPRTAAAREGLVRMLRQVDEYISLDDSDGGDQYVYTIDLIETLGDAAVELTSIQRIIATATELMSLEGVIDKAKYIQSIAEEAKSKIEAHKIRRAQRKKAST